jgi:hypothetical protein
MAKSRPLAEDAASGNVNFASCARSGTKQALIAIARKILVAIYHMLHDRVPYRELGSDYFPHDQPERRAKRLVQQLRVLGFTVQLSPAPATG